MNPYKVFVPKTNEILFVSEKVLVSKRVLKINLIDKMILFL